MRGDADQLSTARLIVAQFEAQIAEFEGMNRQQRRTPRGRSLASRIPKLRAGQTAWIEKIALLEKASDQ